MTEHPDVVLDELELDALTELVNLGVSRAGKNLAAMVREEVVLTVPMVRLVDREEAIHSLGSRESQKLVAVHQMFKGDISGRAFLIFPEAKSFELVRAVIGGELSFEEITEMEQEALAETGNVLLNGCLATIANQLERRLDITLPEVLHGESADFFNLEPPPVAGSRVLLVYINFTVRHRAIQGYIAMMLDIGSLAALKTLIRDFIRRTTEA
jgi:chemotaxis protein CheC